MEQTEEVYLEANRKRWTMARDLIEVSTFVLIPLYPYNYRDESKRGKTPCIPWKDRESTSLRDLQEWYGKFDGYSNLGLVMGVKSGGILGIDVDGAGGHEILTELSKGDLPDTVMYGTPGGDGKGLRYLYWYPDEYKTQAIRQQNPPGKGNHNGVDFLVDGQQSVLPYSIHPNGGIYTFKEGHSFDEIAIATAPAWVMDFLLRKKAKASSIAVKKPTPAPIAENRSNVLVPSVEEMIARSDCDRLKELLEEQKSPASLDEPTWFKCISLLTTAGFSEAAREFSRLSNKYAQHSEDRISELEQKESQGTVRCSTLGCSEVKISHCFQNLHYNEVGEITNSPATKLYIVVKNDGDIGLEYNEEGKFQRVNVNKFLQAFIQRVDLRICDGQRGEDSRYYVYQEQGYWKEARPLEIKRMLKDLLDLYEPNRWNSTLMRHCLEILPVACRNSIDLTNSREYINVTNGLINLATLDLELHRKEIYSTTQLPVAYDEKAAYPNFLAFLQDAFMGDKEIPLLMQEIFGYALSPSLEAQKFFVWVGDGANAKSALAKILSELVGEQNISRVSLRKFGERFGLSSIVDKRLIISTENEMPSRGLDSEMLKAITVGDPVTIERKHADVFEYQPTLKMIFLLNRPPFFLDWSFALRRRMIIVPFEKRYIDGEPMTEFEGKGNKRVVEGLFDDLPGILAWSLEGWKRLRDNEFRFTQPKAIEEYLQEYWLEQNPFLDFVKSCVCRVPGGRLSTRDLCQAIYGFLLDNGLKTLALNLSNRKIIREIEAVLRNERIAFTRKKSHSDRPFYDVMLNLDGLKYLRGEGTCEYQR